MFTPGLKRRVRPLALALLLVAGVLPSTETQAGPATWQPLINLPIVPIHMAMQPDGMILLWGTDRTNEQGGALEYALLDPTTMSARLLGNNGVTTDTFCSLQVLDPQSGMVLTAGGDDGQGGGNVANAGVTFTLGATHISGPGMVQARWYPTGVTLPNGSLLVQGGSVNGTSGAPVTTPELYQPGVGWRALPGAASTVTYSSTQRRWWYPRSWVAPDGRVFTITGSEMRWIDTAGNGSDVSAGTFPGTNIGATSTAVMFRPGLVLQVGGGLFGNGDTGATGSTGATIVDITGRTPVVRSTAPLAQGRHWATSTVLADGDVLVTGGSGLNVDLGTATRAPELYDVQTGTWTTLPAESQSRLYHSTAILLPDARVLSAGGGVPGPELNPNGQVITPPYLTDANGALRARPVISAAPREVRHGNTFEVSASAGTVEFNLVRMGAVTHSFNNGQRFIPLGAGGTGPVRSLRMPDATTAPPGSYMLFAIDGAGTPSVARLINVPIPTDTPVALLVDGFEAGTQAAQNGWVDQPAGSTFGPWSATAPVSRDQAGHHGGRGTVGHHLDLDRAGRAVRTVDGLVPGAQYELRLAAARHKALPAGTVSAAVAVGDEELVFSPTASSGAAFQDVVFRFTANATSEQMVLRGVASPAPWGGAVVDDVTITRI